MPLILWRRRGNLARQETDFWGSIATVRLLKPSQGRKQQSFSIHWGCAKPSLSSAHNYRGDRTVKQTPGIGVARCGPSRKVVSIRSRHHACTSSRSRRNLGPKLRWGRASQFAFPTFPEGLEGWDELGSRNVAARPASYRGWQHVAFEAPRYALSGQLAVLFFEGQRLSRLGSGWSGVHRHGFHGCRDEHSWIRPSQSR